MMMMIFSNIPMSFSHHFHITYVWDASVLDHGITLALLEEIHQEADDSLLKDSMFHNMLLQQKSGQMGNYLAEQQVNNENKAKPK